MEHSRIFMEQVENNSVAKATGKNLVYQMKSKLYA